MSITLKQLRQLSGSLFAELSPIIEHDSEVTRSTWNATVETGKAFELLSLCAIAASTEKMGISVQIPELFYKNPDLFYLRNIIPCHHGGQPGHEGILSKLPLQDRFIAALTPRLRIKRKSTTYEVYREGFPVHMIQMLRDGHPEYKDRPDVLVMEGEVSVISCNDSEIAFSYHCSAGSCDGSLRVKNDINIPLIAYQDQFKTSLPTVGIIECSVGKGRDRAEEQIERYLSLFAGPTRPVSMLINGKKKKCPAYDLESYVNLNDHDVQGVKDSLLAGMDAFVTSFLQIYK